ncbi:hypothetical protein C8Q74DRAFT_1264749 [Fomes fomentarius]|nr:hypothetical protein C8Q74DRAFT_1264749 [Fomes fomentarius]
MSQINVQRRMHPTISHFIRETLPEARIQRRFRYPAVQGVQKDAFFFNHLHKEKGAEGRRLVSTFNTF